MQRQVDSAAYWPPVVGETREFRQLAGAQDPELTEAWDGADRVLRESFLFEAGEYGIGRLEEMLNIIPQAEDTLDTRRWRLYLQMNDRRPYTIRMLRERLDEILGQGGYLLEVRPGEYEVQLILDMAKGELLQVLDELFERVLPANLVRGFRVHFDTAAALHAAAALQQSERIEIPYRQESGWEGGGDAYLGAALSHTEHIAVPYTPPAGAEFHAPLHVAAASATGEGIRITG